MPRVVCIHRPAFCGWWPPPVSTGTKLRTSRSSRVCRATRISSSFGLFARAPARSALFRDDEAFFWDRKRIAPFRVHPDAFVQIVAPREGPRRPTGRKNRHARVRVRQPCDTLPRVVNREEVPTRAEPLMREFHSVRTLHAWTRCRVQADRYRIGQRDCRPWPLSGTGESRASPLDRRCGAQSSGLPTRAPRLFSLHPGGRSSPRCESSGGAFPWREFASFLPGNCRGGFPACERSACVPIDTSLTERKVGRKGFEPLKA